jgi:ATP-dependent exoDNAse (exonuclease V) alpha subunit
MALFHFHAAQVKRSAGQSAVACAAYRAGERLYSEYYGDFSDYTRKGGVICSEILLPSHAPPEYADRQTLWNAVEKAERGKNAQLAYSLDIALQNEFSLEENIALARQFLLENFVSRGMIADFAVHQPDKEGGIQNPHFHVLCPIRPLKENGEWDAKQHRVYVLDEHGNRIRDGDSNFIFNAVPTTDWGKPETLEAWREEWAKLCNAKFAEKGLDCRIDNRSFVRQGVEQLPTVHEGPAVRQMETKGIRTEKRGLNRWIQITNTLLRDTRKKIAALLAWLREAQAELAAADTPPKEPTVAQLLMGYLSIRKNGRSDWNDRAASKGMTIDLKRVAHAVSYMQTNNIRTLDDLQERIRLAEAATTSVREKSDRMKEIKKIMDCLDSLRQLKPLADEYNAIRWKKSREKFREEHKTELNRYYAAKRFLDAHTEETPSNRGVLRAEYDRLSAGCEADSAALNSLNADLNELKQIQWCVNLVRANMQPLQTAEQASTPYPKQEEER